MDLGAAASVVQLCYAIYQTWGAMQALKQELKPFRDIARAIEDAIGEGHHGVPSDRLGDLLLLFGKPK